MAVTNREPLAAIALLSGEAAFGADQHGGRQLQALQVPQAGSCNRRRLIAIDEARARPASREERSSSAGSRSSGTKTRLHCSAASMALARMRSRLMRSDNGAMGDHRTQSPRAQFGCLLHHIIEAGMLQRREEKIDVGRRLHIGDACARSARMHAACVTVAEMGQPFAVRPIEHTHGIAGPQPQDIRQIMALLVDSSACRSCLRRVGLPGKGAEPVSCA